MSPPPPPGRLADDRAGVSSVVSAVLLFALFVTAATLWTFGTLPVWIADREQAHAQQVQEAFSGLQSSLETLSAADDEGPASRPLDLGPEPVALVQSTPARGEVELRDTVRAGATFEGERLLVADGLAAVVPDDDIAEGAGDLLSDVAEVHSLVVRLQTENVGNDDEAWASVVVQDGTSTVTATMTHAGKPGGSGPNVAGCLNSELRLEVTLAIDPFPPTTTTQALLCELAADLTGFSIDLADEQYDFAEGLDRLQVPYTVRLTDGESGGSARATGLFGAAYQDSSGLDRGVGSGREVDYELDLVGPRLAFDAGYQHYAGPDVAWEFGAVVLSQGDGAAIGVAPGFDLVVEDGAAALTWTLVDLRGAGGRSGSDVAHVEVRHSATDDLVLTADSGTFTLVSPNAAAWRAYFTDRILLADAAGEASVGGTGDTATLTIGGGSVDRWTVHLRLIAAEIDIE